MAIKHLSVKQVVVALALQMDAAKIKVMLAITVQLHGCLIPLHLELLIQLRS